MSGICDTTKSMPTEKSKLTEIAKAGFFDITVLPELKAEKKISGSSDGTVEYTEKFDPLEIPYLDYADLAGETGNIYPIATASAAIRTGANSYVVFYPSYYNTLDGQTGSTNEVQIVGDTDTKEPLGLIQKNTENKVIKSFNGKTYTIYIIPTNTSMIGVAGQQGGFLVDAYTNLLNAQTGTTHSIDQVQTMLTNAGDLPTPAVESFKAKAYRGNDLARDHGYSNSNLFLTVDISTPYPHRVYLDVNQEGDPNKKQTFSINVEKIEVSGTNPVLGLAIENKQEPRQENPNSEEYIVAKSIDDADNLYHISYPTKSFHSVDWVLYFDPKENNGYVRNFSESDLKTSREYASRGDFIKDDSGLIYKWGKNQSYILTYKNTPDPNDPTHAQIAIEKKITEENEKWRQRFYLKEDGNLIVKNNEDLEIVILHKGSPVNLRDLPRTVIRLKDTDHVFNIREPPRDFKDKNPINMINQNQFRGWDEWVISGGGNTPFQFELSDIFKISDKVYNINYTKM